MQGRPLRFMAIVIAGWVGWRAFMLWPEASLLPLPVAAAEVDAPIPAKSEPAISWAAAVEMPPPVVAGPTRAPIPMRAGAGHDAAGWTEIRTPPLAPPGMTALPHPPTAPSVTDRGQSPLLPPPVASDRWRASAWLMTRSGGTPGMSRIGGPQAGAALNFALAPRLDAHARLTTPLVGRGTEAAVGIGWQPTRAPVRLIAEHRLGIDGIGGGPAIGMVAGIQHRSPDDRVRIEGYGQAGMIWRDRSEPYGDGFVRIAHPVAFGPGEKIELGLGAWAAAQRDATRLDVGPSVGTRVRIGGGFARATLDWRQRVAGDAQPASGPALTIAADF